MDEPEWLRMGNEGEIRAAIKFDRGEPRLDPGCIDDPVPWQHGKVFHPTGRNEHGQRVSPTEDEGTHQHQQVPQPALGEVDGGATAWGD